jgi:hypothetical protein
VGYGEQNSAVAEEVFLKSMSPGEIIDLKDQFKADPNLIAKTALRIGFILADGEKKTDNSLSDDAVWEDFHKFSFAARVANITVFSNEELRESVRLPVDEWLPDGVPPHLCAIALDQVEEGRPAPSQSWLEGVHG